MTQKEKQLLLKDLCGRLPYGFTLYRESDDCIITIKSNDISIFAHFLEYSESEDFKPYLRSLSSMTEEERETYKMFFNEEGLLNTSVDIYLDWLLENHFDYRSLIKKGLALEAPEGMY